MTDNDDSLYKDLVGFLESNRADLCKVAAEATLSTLTQNGYVCLCHDSKYLYQC